MSPAGAAVEDDGVALVVPGPGGVALALPVPAGWWVGDAEGAAAVLVRTAVPSGFHTNATVQVVEVAPQLDVAAIAAEAARRFAAGHDAVEERGGHADAGRVVRMVWVDAGPTAVRVAQLQAFLDAGVHGDPGRRVIFTIAASCLADDLPELGAELAAIVRHAEVGPADSPLVTPSELVQRERHR